MHRRSPSFVVEVKGRRKKPIFSWGAAAAALNDSSLTDTHSADVAADVAKPMVADALASDAPGRPLTPTEAVAIAAPRRVLPDLLVRETEAPALIEKAPRKPRRAAPAPTLVSVDDDDGDLFLSVVQQPAAVKARPAAAKPAKPLPTMPTAVRKASTARAKRQPPEFPAGQRWKRRLPRVLW